jgi:hypothetical protein
MEHECGRKRGPKILITHKFTIPNKLPLQAWQAINTTMQPVPVVMRISGWDCFFIPTQKTSPDSSQ